MWQVLREELHPQGLEIVTVGQDALGADGCRAAIEAAAPTHPALLDPEHKLADWLGVVNIPNSVWIDEQGVIVRPAEAAPAPPQDSPAAMQPPPDMPERMQQIMAEAVQIESDPEAYHNALRDWVANGAASRFALSPHEVVARSAPRDADRALGHAHFSLACALEQRDRHAEATAHFRRAHQLVPDSWTFRRQAWSLEPVGDGPLARFWQGPDPSSPDRWPYDGDWLTDIRKEGPKNYYVRWQP